MLSSMLVIKLFTILAHLRLSLALSAPRNLITRTIKYIVVPGIVTFAFERKQYRKIISNATELKNEEV
jgi:hypothetical protein